MVPATSAVVHWRDLHRREQAAVRTPSVGERL